MVIHRRRWRSWAHPRWRGEHRSQRNISLTTSGSSPLARGALTGAIANAKAARLIPAGAGSTASCHSLTAGSSAHPRWRGEHLRSMWRRLKPQGSSPLARGALLPHHAIGKGYRLIPAGAGSTCRQCRASEPLQAHPRWRGEHLREDHATFIAGGSSPLARGARSRLATSQVGLRLIPAGAGSTAELVFPRSAAVGSSPLARGALPGRRSGGYCRGLIPAGAGSTSSPPKRPKASAAHPRWRGEHWIDSRAGLRETGSSPLARGARRFGVCGG